MATEQAKPRTRTVAILGTSAYKLGGARAGFALLLVCVAAVSASADDDQPWFLGRHGRNRMVHVSLTLAGGLLYPATISLERSLTPDSCKWCIPTDLDRELRSSWRWTTNVDLARTLSDLGAFALTPAASIGLVLTGTLCGGWKSARVIDDVIPILETVVVALWATRGLKLAVGRQRPYAHFGTGEGPDDNLSFPSAHTSGAFAFATSAAIIARARGYAVEPYLWAGGLTLATATGYLRIVADRHYFTDILAGAAIGATAGLTVPRLMRRDVSVVPMGDGVALAGTW